MGFSITEPVSGLTVVLRPVAGDITIDEGYETAVHRSLRGNSVWVTEGDPQIPTITIPEVMFRSQSELAVLRQIRKLSRRVVLTDDMGVEWPCRFTGSFTYRSVDVPDREVLPLFYAKLSLVGVA
ncbi:hypothetical protein [uncultured Friedmanniella sp.]|uniref:hypothetical protein n=1 Tax=uncultured Friedmanniella sp. TaxID=335381 RepID=UPI0035CBB15E